MMKILKKLGWGALVYVVVKWVVLGTLIFWLSRYAWFRYEYLAVLPILVITTLLVRRFVLPPA